MATHTTAFIGSPVEIAQQAFVAVVLPQLKTVSAHMDTAQLTQFYAGLFSSLLGCMQHDFGADRAHEIAQLFVDAFAVANPYSRETH